MGKNSKAEKRAAALRMLQGNLSDDTRDKVKKALAQYCHDEEIDVMKKRKLDVKLKDLLHVLRTYDERWDNVKIDDINTNKYHGIKLMNNEMHKLLKNPKKLDAMVHAFDSENESSSSESDEVQECTPGDIEMGEAVGMPFKQSNDKKSKAGSNAPKKATEERVIKKEEEKSEENAANSKSSPASHTVSEDKVMESSSNSNKSDSKDTGNKATPSNTVTEQSASIQAKGPEVTEENPLVVTNVNILGKRLRHGQLTTADAEVGVRIAWLLKRIREASGIIKLARHLLDEDVGGDILGLHTMRFGYEEPEPEEPEPNDPEQAKSDAVEPKETEDANKEN